MKTIFLFCCLLCFGGCVSKSKYVELLDNRNRTEEARVRIEQELAGSQAALDNLRTASNKQEDLQSQFDAIQNQNTNLLAEKANMENEILSLREQNTEMKAKLQLSQSDAKSDNNARQWEQVERALDGQKRSYQRLKSDIMNNFSDLMANDQITLVEKEAGLYISLSQDLLFAKGSDLIQPKGISTLARLTPIISNQSQVTAVVKGHTDNDGDVKYNWNLSTRRAVAVVQVLMDNGMPGERITASGRALFDPIVTNDTSENKAKNRRIEIIVYHNLERILSILN